MKYRDLVQFEPIESVVQLIEADAVDYAEKLVTTYVISDGMAERLTEVVFEQLQFERPADNKGLLVVGNYGTGKSHLMSVVSAVAEHGELAEKIRHPAVREKALEIGGKFRVIRTEIGSTTMSLRNFVVGELEAGLAKLGVDFTFPPEEEVRNNKDAFHAMMGAFETRYPDQGLLLVIDELLDYLRTRKEHDLIRDLNFLREMGETCRTTRFRVIGGVQEMLFDNPRFQFVAEQLRRVRDRFEQVRIVREDVATVVAERLLKKDERQKAWVREHLAKFTRLYDNLNERMETYVSLFPVHPAYLEAFEQVAAVEKREILKTLSAEIRKRFDETVPEDEPGIIAYDSYWPYLEGNVSNKTDPDLKKVIDTSKVLREKVVRNITQPSYKALALRIVNALSVHRLTTGDITNRIGVTPNMLRDDLFLFSPTIADEDADFLSITIETVLKEIQKAASGEYIAFNKENGQYYLDVEGGVDVERLIEQKAETLSDAQLDRHYFDALEKALECSDTPYRSGFRLWPHELLWADRKVTRPGYLFLGTPNERSTAQPPRDFYLYMVQPFDPPRFRDEQRGDEVFFRLVHRDETFMHHMTRYAAARELEINATTATKRRYVDHISRHLKSLNAWLRENFGTAFRITHKGVSKKASEYLSGLSANATLREMVDHVGAACLSAWFEERYPDYPSFRAVPGSTGITVNNRDSYADSALKWLAGHKTAGGEGVLKGLVLLHGGKVEPQRSAYAKWILDLLEKKGEGQVLNRSELIEELYGGEVQVAAGPFRLEPEWVAVILAALVYAGLAEIQLPGEKIDATGIERLASLPVKKLVEFKYVKKPSGLPLGVLRELFDLLDVQRGLLSNPNDRQLLETAVHAMQRRINDLLEATVKTLRVVKSGIPCWDGFVLSEAERQALQTQLADWQDFLQSLTRYNTPAKLNNLHVTVDEVKKQQAAFSQLARVEQLKQRADDIQAHVAYLNAAAQTLPGDHSWIRQVAQLRHQAIAAVHDGRAREVVSKMVQLKQAYIDLYLDLHGKHRLGYKEDERKARLSRDPRLAVLNELARIELLPRPQLTYWRERLAMLQSCWKLTRDQLESHPVCPACRFKPAEEPTLPSTDLDTLEDELQRMFDEWTAMLHRELAKPELREAIDLLAPEQRELIEKFLDRQALSEPLDPAFIEAARTVLRGIEKAVLRIDELAAALGGGAPLTVEEVKARFDALLGKLTQGKEPARLRIILQWTEREGIHHGE